MWPPAGVILAIFGIASASIFPEGPSPSETEANNHGASFSSNLDRRENPNFFTDPEVEQGRARYDSTYRLDWTKCRFYIS